MVSAVYSIGLDFGTASARTLLLDLRSGKEVAVCEVAYSHGVISDMLPGSSERLPSDWALHDPDDYFAALEAGVAGVLAERPEAAPQVIGIGLDATSCTVLPVTQKGEPLCRSAPLRSRPHSWAKLWKHHAAQAVANRLSEVATDREEPFLGRYGGRISSEWYFPKLIQVWLEDREVYEATGRFLEVADWLVWQLTGSERRSACPASYKALWSEERGIPTTAYFEAAYPGFSRPEEKLGRTFLPLGSRAGYLRPELARRLGLPGTVAVAVGNVDSFVSFPGVGAESTGSYVMVIGTSICDMVVHPKEIFLTGMTGVAKDGIFPGLYGYEAGQPAVGDMLAWFGDKLAPSGVNSSPGQTLAGLERAAAVLAPAQTGLVALDWWNGNRSVLADADLSGVIAGLTLQTTPTDVYRALLESIAFGNKAILDSFAQEGFQLDEIHACGGIADKSPFLMQLLADVSGLPVKVPASSQVPARGSALFGAVAAGEEAGGFADITGAASALRPPPGNTYLPRPDATETYRKIYHIWKGLHDTFGHSHAVWLHDLKQLKRQARPERPNSTTTKEVQ
ncbi:MAG: ribulokinase [Acidimicrobiales bacterium]